MIDTPAPAAPRSGETDRRRGDAILAVMQAKRAYLEETRGEISSRSDFDEAHAIVGRLTAQGFVFVDEPAKATAKVEEPAA